MEIPIGGFLVALDGHTAPLAATSHDNKLLAFLPCEMGIKKAKACMEILHTVFKFDSLGNKWIICESNSTLVLHGS